MEDAGDSKPVQSPPAISSQWPQSRSRLVFSQIGHIGACVPMSGFLHLKQTQKRTLDFLARQKRRGRVRSSRIIAPLRPVEAPGRGALLGGYHSPPSPGHLSLGKGLEVPQGAPGTPPGPAQNVGSRACTRRLKGRCGTEWNGIERPAMS
jgi:hypothetical protein